MFSDKEIKNIASECGIYMSYGEFRSNWCDGVAKEDLSLFASKIIEAYVDKNIIQLPEMPKATKWESTSNAARNTLIEIKNILDNQGIKYK